MNIVEFRKARKKDCDEFERLYRQSYASVYSSVLFRMRNEEAARDVVSDAFLKAARYFDRYDSSRASFSTWVNAIARNCETDYYRKRKDYIPIEEASAAALVDDSNTEMDVANADLVRRLLECLDECDCEIVRLKYYEGLPNTEIARELGMNPSTVATRLQRALAKMRAAAEGKHEQGR